MIFVKMLIAILWYVLFGLVYFFVLDKFDRKWWLWFWQHILDRVAEKEPRVKFVPDETLQPIMVAAFIVGWPFVFLGRVLMIIDNLVKGAR